MANFITVIVAGTQELINVEKIVRVKPLSVDSCRVYMDGLFDITTSGSDLKASLNVQLSYEEMVKRITQATGKTSAGMMGSLL